MNRAEHFCCVLLRSSARTSVIGENYGLSMEWPGIATTALACSGLMPWPLPHRKSNAFLCPLTE